MTDPIADMLTRIRNAQMAKKSEVVIPFSKLKMRLAEILKQEGYIKKVGKIEDIFSEIKVTLKYDDNKTPYIRRLTRISKGGRRVYVGKTDMPRVLNGMGIAIVSTSQGLLTNREAKKAGVGGEIICEIY